jgi:integrase
MASLSRITSRGRNGWTVRFIVDSKRKTISLPAIDESVATIWRSHVEHLVAIRGKSSPSLATSVWVAGLTAADQKKLVAVGLIEPISAPPSNETTAPRTLKAFINWYISRRNVKPATVSKWNQTRDSLTKHFGDGREVTSITTADAEAWREWLAKSGNNREGKTESKDRRTDLGDNTVRRRTGIARQFFNYAIKAKLISSNPFDGLPATVHGNESRQFFITMDVFKQVIESCPSIEWEAIVALSRIGGLRCPSETLRLRWEDVDFANGRIRIHASKTEHHKDAGIRDCPMFVELRPYLEQLAELAKCRGAKTSDPVIANLRGSEAYLRTSFLKILKKAGIMPWPKVFHNLRASRETELLDDFPIKDVCSWIGNSQAVAMKHYAMRREDSFSRANGTLDSATRIGAHIGAHKERQSEAIAGN